MINNKMMKFGSLIILATGTLSLGACSTSSSMLAQGAPITYKLDQGQYQQALVNTPYTQTNVTRPHTPVPQQMLPSPAPSVATPTPTPIAQKFYQNRVDKTLYKHQRIGKRYTIAGKSYTPKHQPNYNAVGTASWYGNKFQGKPTATGELYNMYDLTAAHKTLPLNSMVYVTNMETGKGIMVRVNDRGPFVANRIIDLSRASAQALGFFNQGLATVRVQYAGPADPNAAKNTLPMPMLEYAVPEPKSKPEFVAGLPKYKSLRDMEKTATPRVANPLQNLLGTPPASPVAMPVKPQPAAPQMDQNAQLPSAPQTVVPEFALEPEGDDPVTLTIKGPVHMASDKNDGSQTKPKFIPTVNYTYKPAEK
ncbi:MAG: septal ring lytic transglycosylase RlpA family protein [Robiginitomaculum sp.]